MTTRPGDRAADSSRSTPTPTPSEVPARRLTFEEKVVRAFFRDDRLVSIPARQRKRLVVLRELCGRCFTEDRAYPEREVNQRLALFHRDVAAIRRDMVDHGLMTREAGEYRRVDSPTTQPASARRSRPPDDPPVP